MIKNMLMFNHKFEQIPATIDDITMLGSSSGGNSLYIKPYDIIIDMGMPFSKYDPEIFHSLKYILLTHEHIDHFVPSTISTIMTRFPHIKFLMTEHLLNIGYTKFEKAKKTLNESRVQLLTGEPIIYTTSSGDTAVIYHTVTDHGDIPNVSYTIKGFTPIDCFQEPVILYASDLKTTHPSEIGQGLPTDEKYNLMFLEANYDEDELIKALYANPANKLYLDMYYDQFKVENEEDIDIQYTKEQMIKDLSSNLDNVRMLGNFRHLTEKESFEYVRSYLSEDGLFIPLHGSSDYGSFIQSINRKGNE